MNVLDLFSGIGGFSVGLGRAGMRTIGFCEIDPYCRAVLAKHWPGVPIFDEISDIDADGLAGLGRIDLICGGFPCQPFSVAGIRQGKKDHRNLWPEMFRVVSLARPAWVCAENVTGLISMALDDVLADLEGIGYATRAIVVPACGVGAPHRRDRLWIIATDTNSDGRRRFEQERQPDGRDADASGHGAQGHAGTVADTHGGGIRQQSGRRDGANGKETIQPAIHGEARSVANANGLGQQEHGECHSEPNARIEVPFRDDVSRCSANDVADTGGTRLSIPEQHLLSGSRRRDKGRTAAKRSWWSVEPGMGRVAYGVRNRVDRLRCLGNAVVPQIVEEIGRAIMKESRA